MLGRCHVGSDTADVVALALCHGANPMSNGGEAAIAAATGPGLDNDVHEQTRAAYRHVMQQVLDATPTRAGRLTRMTDVASGRVSSAALPLRAPRQV